LNDGCDMPMAKINP